MILRRPVKKVKLLNGMTSHVNNSSASALMPPPFISLPKYPSEGANGMHHPYTREPGNGNNMPGLIRHAPVVHSDHGSTNLRGSLRSQEAWLSGLNQPQVHMNFVPTPSIMPAGYYINADAGDGKASDVCVSQITGSSLYSGCNPYVAQTTTETMVNNNAKVGAYPPGRIDGSFLTLGIGGNSEPRTKQAFSSREIASNLEQSGNFHVGQTSMNFPTLSHNVTGSSGFQSNPAWFTGSMYSSLGALISASNNNGIPYCGTVGLSSNAIQSSHMPDVFKQYDFFQSDNRNLGIASKFSGVYPANGPHYNPSTASSLSSSSTNTYASHPGYAKFYDQSSESAKFVQTNNEPTMSHWLNCHAINCGDADPCDGSCSSRLASGPLTQEYLGKLIPAVQGYTKAVGGGHSPMGIQPVEATSIMPATIGPFPRRLGVQPYDGRHSVTQFMPPRVMGVQPRSGVCHFQPVQLTTSLLGTPCGYAQDGLPPQFNDQAPLSSSGPEMRNSKGDNPFHMADAVGQPVLKRRAVELPPASSWGRRRKLVTPSGLQSSIYPRQRTAATHLPSVPSGTPHIRWQGFDKLPQLVGRKCLICNRDLSFTPEGPVSQPDIPPAVAVLSCGHVFHDHCLERITPEDQIKDPPCIPCAIGST